MTSPEVQHFLETLQSDDSLAVENVLRQIDPFLRRVIRQRLIDGRLRRVVDTSDIFHSVVEDFLARNLSTPATAAMDRDGDRTPLPASAALVAYLAASVHHKIQTRLRKEKRHAGSLSPDWDPVSPDASPSHLIQEQDYLEAIRARLSEDRQQLFDLKLQGLTWDEIAERVRGSADGLRMRLTRAIAAILHEFDCAEVSHAP